MRILILAVSLLAGLCACNPVPPLTNAEKAKFVFELIEDGHNCDSYRARVEAPGIESPAIDNVYRDATRTGCIKRDV